MEILQKRGALTHFQILGEISKQEPNLKQKDERLHQVSLALKSLGYSTSEIKNTIKQLKLDLNTSIEDALKQALKLLNS